MSLHKVVMVVLVTIFCSLGHAEPPPTKGPPAHPIPFKKEGEVSAGQLFRIAGVFVAVIALGVGAIYLLKRYLPGIDAPKQGERKRIRLLEVRRLTPKTMLFLVEVDGATLLLSQHGDRLAVIDPGEASRKGPATSKD